MKAETGIFKKINKSPGAGNTEGTENKSTRAHMQPLAKKWGGGWRSRGGSHISPLALSHGGRR